MRRPGESTFASDTSPRRNLPLCNQAGVRHRRGQRDQATGVRTNTIGMHQSLPADAGVMAIARVLPSSDERPGDVVVLVQDRKFGLLHQPVHAFAQRVEVVSG